MDDEADYHGRISNAYWGLYSTIGEGTGVGAFSAITNVIEWSITLTCTTAECTTMNASAFGKERMPGFIGATATVTCHLSGDNQIDEGLKGALELVRTRTTTDLGYKMGMEESGGDANDGTPGVICTGVENGVDKDGIETVTYSFQAITTVSKTVTQPAA